MKILWGGGCTEDIADMRDDIQWMFRVTYKEMYGGARGMYRSWGCRGTHRGCRFCRGDIRGCTGDKAGCAGGGCRVRIRSEAELKNGKNVLMLR